MESVKDGILIYSDRRGLKITPLYEMNEIFKDYITKYD
jgi:hypothetical protein